jgi:hypothetical protein
MPLLANPAVSLSPSFRVTSISVSAPTRRGADVPVEPVVGHGVVVAARGQEREQHDPALARLETPVLEVVDAGQVVGGDVLLRRAGQAGDPAAAQHVGVLAVAVGGDVADRPQLLDPAHRPGGGVDHIERVAGGGRRGRRSGRRRRRAPGEGRARSGQDERLRHSDQPQAQLHRLPQSRLLFDPCR